MPTNTELITTKALDLVGSNPDGLSYSELHRRIMQALPSMNSNTVNGTIWNLDARFPKEIYKPSRGIFRNIKFREAQSESKPSVAIPASMPSGQISEERFYQSFADYLIQELEECTKAIPLGGNKFKDKWGTPDIIGIREARKSDIIKSDTEVVAAELKTDTNQLITAFGQACSYKLFSHKSYIVIPKKAPKTDIDRLDALCLIFGIGLILFDNKNPSDPQFEIRVRAARHEPDMFFVNTNLKLIEEQLFS